MDDAINPPYLERERERERERENERDRKTLAERERPTNRERERDRQTARQRERQRERVSASEFVSVRMLVGERISGGEGDRKTDTQNVLGITKTCQPYDSCIHHGVH